MMTGGLPLFVLLFPTFIMAASPETYGRKLESFLNPGCAVSCGNMKIQYVKAEGLADTIHYLWDLTKKPTFAIIVTPSNASLSIDWKAIEKSQAGSVNFTSKPTYTFGIILNEIYEYEDESDSGEMSADGNTTRLVMNTENFNWKIGQVVFEYDELYFPIVAEGYNKGNLTKNGSITLMAHAYAHDGHAPMLPKMLHNENTTQMDVTFNGLTTAYPTSRFAVNFLIFSSDSKSTEVVAFDEKTIDDEYTPGVFEVDVLKVRQCHRNDPCHSGFLQWRPIVYTYAGLLDVVNSTETKRYVVQNVTEASILNPSLFYEIYGHNSLEMMAKTINISFGMKEDGFYSKTNYTTWSILVGMGHPPRDGFSNLVQYILGICIGVPLLLASAWVACICKKMSASVYSRLR